jgi:DNA-binding beta-propeller fold protein YncE
MLYTTYVSSNGLSKAHGIGLAEIVPLDLTVEESKFNANQTSGMISNSSSLYSNPRFVLFDNKSGMVSSGLRSFWNDPDKSCNTNFKCTADFSTGWKDKSSFQISTTNNANNTWSWIYGQPIDVKPNEKYQLVTHMKLNQWAMQSHVPLEGFNKTSNKWDQISQCPSGTSGPLNWQEFSCPIRIPDNTTKIRPVLNAGWSSQLGKEAITLLDSLYMVKVETQASQEFHHIQKFTTDGKFITSWGSKGTGDGKLLHPHSIAVDSSGNVYISDDEKNNIIKFDSNGKFITKWGIGGTGNAQFNQPEDITIDNSGNIFVVDEKNHNIQKFTSDGKFISVLATKGTADGQLRVPWGIAIDSSGNIFVTEIKNDRIQKFTSDGKFITKWGSNGTGAGQFIHLHGIVVDSNDNVYAVDQDNFKIEKFTNDGKSIKRWGSYGCGEGQFREHHGIAVDSQDNIYVVDSQNERIQKFTSDGKFIKSWGSEGTGRGQFWLPHDIFIDSSDNVYVADSGEVHHKKAPCA